MLLILYTKINIFSQSVSKEYDHSISVFTVGLNCVWIVVTGGYVELHKETIDGVVKYRNTFVSQPNITMIIELGKQMYQLYISLFLLHYYSFQ